MDLAKYINKCSSVISKYRIPMLVLLLGIVLMILPNFKTDNKEYEKAPQQEESISLENELSDVLSKIDGAGKVCVYISYSSGEETIYQEDVDSSSTDTSSTQRNTTVIITNGDRSEAGLVKQVNPPKIQGIIIACQGADRASVRLAIVDAVSKATGLGADSIAVLKMK